MTKKRIDSIRLAHKLIRKLIAYGSLLSKLNDRTNAQQKRLDELSKLFMSLGV